MRVLAVVTLIEITRGNAHSPKSSYCQIVRDEFWSSGVLHPGYSWSSNSFLAGVSTLQLHFRRKLWNEAGTTLSISAQVHVQLLSAQHPVPAAHHVQISYGALGNFFGSLARTAKHIIFPSLVRLSRNVVSDVLENKKTLLDSARHWTMEALRDAGSRIRNGEGKRKRKKKAKKVVSKNKHKKPTKKAAKKSEQKRVNHSRHFICHL